MSNDIQTSSNLLAASGFKKFTPAESNTTTTTIPAGVSTGAQLPPQPATDVYQPTTANVPVSQMTVGKFVEKFSGPAALAVSVVGLPVMYSQAKKANLKAIENLKGPMEKLAKDFQELNLPKMVSEAVAEAVEKAGVKTGGGSVARELPRSGFLTTMFVGLGSGLGIAEFLKNKTEKLKEHGYTDEDIETAKAQATSILETPAEALKTARGISGVAQEAKATAYEAKNTAYGARDTVNSFDQRINEANNRATEAIKATELGLDPLMQQYTVRHYDLNLLQVLDYAKKIDLKKTEEAMNAIHNAAGMRLTRSAENTVKAIKDYKDKYPELTSTWSLTAEYAPIKTGGLGVVPVDIQDNFERLGIETPTFIPMYLKKNQSEFVELPGDRFEYKYGKDTFKLTKLAETRLPVFRNGQTKPENVEYYMSEQPVIDSNGKTKTLVFIKSDNYFNDNIYDSTTNAEETERFALFTKAVFNLAKVKVNLAFADPKDEHPKTGCSNLKICNRLAFDNLHAPNSMILNDWHAGSMAGLLRYRIPMEYNYNEVPKKTFEAMKDMPLLMIGHNMSAQGNSNASEKASLLGKNRIAENIINTLYDNYAIGITEHAHSGIVFDKDKSNDDLCNTVLLKRKTAGKHFNHLFHGVALSDWFVPVSKNYTTECINDPSKSGIVYTLLQRRQQSGTISGIINGLDKNKVDMNAVQAPDKNFVKGLNLAVYDKNTPIDEVMEKRELNKSMFYDSWIKPLMMDRTLDKPEVVGDYMDISKEDFMNAPVIGFAHRLTNQKGLSIMKGATFRLFDNWEKLFPGKPMPYFIIGGPPEDAKQLPHLDALKNPDFGTNKERLNRVLALKGNMPNPAIMSACAFFCAPSTFEPCGLTQGESFAKGTPVITTDVGGFHDTIVDGKTGFLAPEVSEESFYNKMVEALRMYYERPEDYKKMVQNDLEIDFSWVQKDKQGPIFEYTDKLGFDRTGLPDIAA